MLPLGFRLRPATPCWGVGVCVCLCACSVCTPPLLAGACGVGVCVWARVLVAPRHSWLGCWGAFDFVGALYSYPATPGSGVRLECVCLGSGFGCAPPLLAGVLGCVCAGVGALLAPRHSWLGCTPWVCVFGLGFWLRPATSRLFVRLCVCWCGRSACTSPLLAGGWRRGCFLVFRNQLHPATLRWGVGVCVCWCGRSACTPPHLAGLRAVGVCVWARVSAAHRFPGWGVGLCVCWCGRSACTPPLLAGVCAVGVCVWARVSTAARHSWLGCWALCVLVCALCLHPATPGWGARCWCVCLGSGFGCAPPPLAGVLGCACLCACSPCTPPLLAGVRAVSVCVWARVSAAPRNSWLGCWGVCVLVCVPPLYPATPGWGVRCGCVCLGSGFGCAPPLLAGLLGCVCARVRALRAPCHSWLGCAPWVCVFGLGFRLLPATPGWGVGLCVCWCGRSACLPPLLAGVRAGMCVCLGSGSGCTPQLLGGVLGCVCAVVSALLAPRHSWLGCAPWVCVFGLGFRLRPATPGWGVELCVCWCRRSACTQPLLAGPRAVGVCVWARVSAAPCHSWLGCWGVCVLVPALRLDPATAGWGARRGCVFLGSGFGCAPPLLAGMFGCVCARVRGPLVPRHSWLGCAVWLCVFGLRFWLRPATPG